jgi:hypothetical protein
MRGNLKKRGLPAPVRSAVLAVLLVGSLLLLMLFCGWLFAGVSGAMISTGLEAIALMLVRKISPQFFLLLSGARSIDSEDMPALPSRRGPRTRRNPWPPRPEPGRGCGAIAACYGGGSSTPAVVSVCIAVVQLLAAASIEADSVEHALRGAQFRFDRALHDLRSEFIVRENKLAR